MKIEKEKAFLEVPRQEPKYRPVEERVRDFRPVELPLSEEEIRTQAARCMDCGTPFCHGSSSGCPLGNFIPEFNEQVYYGRWDEALDLLLATNPFPEFTGRVCPAPCESACVLGISLLPVTICKIELSIVEKGFASGYIAPRPPPERIGQRVAVVGSGPAGLAAAFTLNRAGVNVTVYEKDPRPGGILRYGIPDFKLEKNVIDRRISLMEKEGVRFECGVDVGRDVAYGFLHRRHDAIVLATGARQPRDLNVPGRDLQGIHFAMDYLTQQNRINAGERIPPADRITATGKKVVVIGGGDTGSDCIGTAWRQGARQVTQLEILPEPPASRADSTPWPLWPLKKRESTSHKEGPTRRLWSISTTAFLGESGQVRRLKCVRVEWRSSDGGRQHPHPIPGTEFTLEADLVLLAMGFVGPGYTGLIDDLKLTRDCRGFLARDDQGMTAVPGVYVCGDMHRGPSLVVHALADGIRTARAVLDRLAAGGR